MNDVKILTPDDINDYIIAIQNNWENIQVSLSCWTCKKGLTFYLDNLLDDITQYADEMAWIVECCGNPCMKTDRSEDF